MHPTTLPSSPRVRACRGLTSCPDQDSQGWHRMHPTTLPSSPRVRACRIWRCRPIRRPDDRLACLLTVPVSPAYTRGGPGPRLWARLLSLKKASPVRTRQLPALVALCLVGVGSDSAQPQVVQGDQDPCL